MNIQTILKTLVGIDLCFALISFFRGDYVWVGIILFGIGIGIVALREPSDA